MAIFEGRVRLRAMIPYIMNGKNAYILDDDGRDLAAIAKKNEAVIRFMFVIFFGCFSYLKNFGHIL